MPFELTARPFCYRVRAGVDSRRDGVTFLAEQDIQKNRDYILVKDPLYTGYVVLRFASQEHATIFALWVPHDVQP